MPSGLVKRLVFQSSTKLCHSPKLATALSRIVQNSRLKSAPAQEKPEARAPEALLRLKLSTEATSEPNSSKRVSSILAKALKTCVAVEGRIFKLILLGPPHSTEKARLAVKVWSLGLGGSDLDR